MRMSGSRLDFEDQIAVVTGAAQGIGAAVVGLLLDRGCIVHGWDIASDNEHANLDRAGYVPLRVDVSKEDQVGFAIGEVLRKHGTVHVCVNNVGISGPTGGVETLALSDWDRIMTINAGSVFLCCKAVAPAMRQSGYGRIVNMASVVGLRGTAGGSAYAASKGAVIALTKSLAKELINDGVSVNCIAPTMTETALLAQMSEHYVEDIRGRIPMGRLARPAEVAEMVLWAASRACSFTTGAVFDVSGGRLTS
jgi:2-dehydro-3-deoxy-L-rhamnonate dehydrogenase (NAD+)